MNFAVIEKIAAQFFQSLQNIKKSSGLPVATQIIKKGNSFG
jgi:hypothetical protein